MVTANIAAASNSAPATIACTIHARRREDLSGDLGGYFIPISIEAFQVAMAAKHATIFMCGQRMVSCSTRSTQ